MASASSKQPPRFLPTLTEVVRQGARAGKNAGAAEAGAAFSGSAGLASVDVDLADASASHLPVANKAIAKAADKSSGKSHSKDNHLDESNETLEVNISRVLLRLEAPMLAKIRLSVAELVDAHIRQLSPLIDKEIETIVRDAVREGVTAELVRVRKQSG